MLYFSIKSLHQNSIIHEKSMNKRQNLQKQKRMFSQATVVFSQVLKHLTVSCLKPDKTLELVS